MIQTIDIEALLERADKLERDAAALRKAAELLKKIEEPGTVRAKNRVRCKTCRRAGRRHCPVHGADMPAPPTDGKSNVKKTPESLHTNESQKPSKLVIAAPPKPKSPHSGDATIPAPKKPVYRDPSSSNVRISSGKAALAERAAADLERKRSETPPKPGQVKVTRADGSTFWRAPRGSKKPSDTSGSQVAASVTKTPKSNTTAAAGCCDNCNHRVPDGEKCPTCGKAMCKVCTRAYESGDCKECHDSAVPE